MMLPPKDPAEEIVIEFDFSSEMSAITSAVVSISIVGSGVDPDVATMPAGAHQVIGTSVFQRIQAGVDGVNYKPRCEASHDGDVIVRAAVLPVRAA